MAIRPNLTNWTTHRSPFPCPSQIAGDTQLRSLVAPWMAIAKGPVRADSTGPGTIDPMSLALQVSGWRRRLRPDWSFHAATRQCCPGYVLRRDPCVAGG